MSVDRYHNIIRSFGDWDVGRWCGTWFAIVVTFVTGAYVASPLWITGAVAALFLALEMRPDILEAKERKEKKH
jgi:hypothetical protein